MPQLSAVSNRIRRRPASSFQGGQQIGGGSGSPSGPAGGVLAGDYPDPDFAVDMATQAELDAKLSIDSIVIREVPTGDVDGVNDEFVLADTPILGTECVFKQKLLQTDGIDYSIAGDTITFTAPPTIGDVIVVNYFK